MRWGPSPPCLPSFPPFTSPSSSFVLLHHLLLTSPSSPSPHPPLSSQLFHCPYIPHLPSCRPYRPSFVLVVSHCCPPLPPFSSCTHSAPPLSIRSPFLSCYAAFTANRSRSLCFGFAPVFPGAAEKTGREWARECRCSTKSLIWCYCCFPFKRKGMNRPPLVRRLPPPLSFLPLKSRSSHRTPEAYRPPPAPSPHPQQPLSPFPQSLRRFPLSRTNRLPPLPPPSSLPLVLGFSSSCEQSQHSQAHLLHYRAPQAPSKMAAVPPKAPSRTLIVVLVTGMLVTGCSNSASYPLIPLRSSPSPVAVSGAFARRKAGGRVVSNPFASLAGLWTKYQDMQCVENCDDPDPSKHVNFERPSSSPLFLPPPLSRLTPYSSTPSQSPSLRR